MGLRRCIYQTDWHPGFHPFDQASPRPVNAYELRYLARNELCLARNDLYLARV